MLKCVARCPRVATSCMRDPFYVYTNRVWLSESTIVCTENMNVPAKTVYNHWFDRVDYCRAAVNGVITIRRRTNKKMMPRRFYFSRNLSLFLCLLLSLSLFFASSPPQSTSCCSLANCTAYVNVCAPRCHVAAIALVFFLFLLLF